MGEAVFVPRAADADESDGWLMLLVYSADTDTSALHILNAEDVDGRGRRPSSICRSACRRASTATGCPTRADRSGAPSLACA